MLRLLRFVFRLCPLSAERAMRHPRLMTFLAARVNIDPPHYRMAAALRIVTGGKQAGFWFRTWASEEFARIDYSCGRGGVFCGPYRTQPEWCRQWFRREYAKQETP